MPSDRPIPAPATTPYWWTALPPGNAGVSGHGPRLETYDVAIVGAGLTGSAAADVLASAGRSVVVLDAREPGGGASSRNGAMLGRYFRHSFSSLAQTRGLDVAKAYFSELSAVYDDALQRLRHMKVPTGLSERGRIVGAIDDAHRESLWREWELRARHTGEDVAWLSPGDPELPTERYRGGIHIRDNAAVNPALYTQAMLDAARDAGAEIHGHSPVLGIERYVAGYRLHLNDRTLHTRDVLIATNGYTPKGQRWHSRRLIPIVAHMVATEPLPERFLGRLRDGRRTYHDNRKNSNYYQISQDGRLIFGGRTGLRHRSAAHQARMLKAEMTYFFPELAGVQIANAWQGRCAATQDMFPHVGVHDGIHFALGYCFSGLAMAPWLGRKAAMAILGRQDEARTLFRKDDLAIVPWPARQERLMPIAMRYYRWRETLPR